MQFNSGTNPGVIQAYWIQWSKNVIKELQQVPLHIAIISDLNTDKQSEMQMNYVTCKAS